MTTASVSLEAKLSSFLCEHFDARELMHLARGVLDSESNCIHSLLPETSSPLSALVTSFIGVLKRHGLLDDEFFHSLCAARPRLKGKIRAIWDEAHHPPKLVESCPRKRLRLRLEVELDDLSGETIEELLRFLQSASGDKRMMIESITTGSTVVVIRGEAPAIERVFEALSQATSVVGLRIIDVEPVLDEPRRGAQFAVRALTRAQTEAFRTTLIARRDAILAKVPKLRETDLPHPSDDSDFLREWDKVNSRNLTGHDRYVLNKIALALEKIDKGNFGLCEECEEPISLSRLRARPEALQCLLCKEASQLPDDVAGGEQGSG